ncbi:MAG: aldolase/citrate lyase family protein [Armatimonadota bacterium]|nr:aldolase/citrate lyase family protein [Armatimonadota bacterium]
MRTNKVKEQLRAGIPSIGTWLVFPDPFVAQVMARLGFDWVNVEMEHSPTSLETAALMFQSIAAAGSIPLVRVPWNTPENVKRVLDCGAWGIVFPMQNSRAEVEQAVAAVKYPPAGFRSVGGYLHAFSFATEPGVYYQRANEETLVVVQAEHIRAVERADEILSVPGIDAVFIGPQDLTASMGLPPSPDCADPRVAEAVEHVRATAVKHGVAPGIHVMSPEAVQQRVAEGFRFIALASDQRFMVSAARAALTAARG